MAQGDLVVGGFGAEGGDGSRITVNVPSVGRIAGGAIVERGVETSFTQEPNLTFNLLRPDFTTAMRIAQRVNEMLGGNVASALDAGSVHVRAPENIDQRVSFMSMLENIEVDPGEAPARVVINSRTGTIVVGNHVTVEPVAVTHGSLTVVGVPPSRLTPMTTIDCGGSATLVRLLMGLLGGLGVDATLVGSPMLSRRPMGRVGGPLRALFGRDVILTTNGH
jgi:flagellar basal body P-ring protein FlgI